MQVISSSPVVSLNQSFNSCSATDVAEIASNFQDLSLSLKLNEVTGNELEKFEDDKPLHDEEKGEIEAEEEEEEEFSFVCMNPDGSPISADDIFQNGQIRPVYPLFNTDLLFADGDSEAKNSFTPALLPPFRKPFVEEHDHALSTSSSEADEPEGLFCVWKEKAMEASPNICKKSNSTGFSKLRRFRELVLRSNSDGKDAFVFLNHHNHNDDHKNHPSTVAAAKASTKPRKADKSEKIMEKKRQPEVKGEKASSAHERFYVSNRARKEEHKRKSYLPYRVGFFTNINGLTRNIHPY
ncbi:uncharacterized protein LOC110630085 [Manihot esculenta]|uniref:Uncharacterized protein n=1 Tax=Manihot esculenta TaxID=3983 RepID=A0A2C9UNF2_MANES|nr:uncharacterized protein LOC110630085 [Manihot esculenta]OAY32588.1 hypothetical protein MANES_13G029800v8 [Manihot esculenta]